MRSRRMRWTPLGDRLAKKKNSPTKKSGSASGSRSKGVRIRNVFERGMTSKVVTENSTGGGGGGDGDAGGVRRALEMDVVEEIAPGTVVDEGQQPAQEDAAGVEGDRSEPCGLSTRYSACGGRASRGRPQPGTWGRAGGIEVGMMVYVLAVLS